MKVPTQLENLIQFTTDTANTLEEIAGSFQIPFLASVAVLSLSIMKCVESMISNKDKGMIMVEEIHEILCTIAMLCSTSEIKGVLPTALLYDIAKFSELLQKIFTLLKGQKKMGKIKQLFKQPDNARRRHELCKQELLQAVEMFRVRAGGSTLSHIGQMKKDAKQYHDELMALLDAHPDLTSSDRSSVIGTLSSSSNSSGSFSLLPASPKIFHGRESELDDVVNILIQELAHVVILGAGEAALQTFIEVADDGHNDDIANQLLELTGNLPLAVSLIASVASSEGCVQALSRWTLENTWMLSEGHDQRSSLDISIMLSYTSSRMTPGAQVLLSILSMLPDGLTDADLVHAQFPITNILSCKTTLIQTSLAFVDQEQHLRVLVPI
ncbi:hypothetical protein C8J57DRAFT_1513713 [Mycena rebaudengoi]|nr:hypothetical protein C8J57DRAFT_1513713 [Mycena rebaudengoi]